MANIKLNATRRDEIGKNRINKTRQDNKMPGVIYAKGEETIVVKVDEAEFVKVFRMAGSSTLVDLDLEGQVLPVIIKDVQKDPVKGNVLHADFQKLDMKEKVKITVPIVLVNRDSIRRQPSILMQLLDQVDVECLPAHMPNTADVNVEDMDFSTPMFVKDLDIAANENITILRDLEDVVCTLSEPTKSAEAEEIVEDGSEDLPAAEEGPAEEE